MLIPEIFQTQAFSFVAEASLFSCTGATINCTAGQDCSVRWPVNPVDPSTCKFESACISLQESTDGILAPVLEIYDDTVFARAFDGEKLNSDPMSQSHNEGPAESSGGAAVVTIRVKPYAQMGDRAFMNANAVVVLNSNNRNIGHILGDIIWPAFQMIHSVNEADTRNEFHFVMGTKNVAGGGFVNMADHKFIIKYIESFSRLKAFSLQKKQICFNSVFAGSNLLGYATGRTNPSVLGAFKKYLFRQNGYSEVPQLSTREDPSILFIEKTPHGGAHKSWIANSDQLKSAVIKFFPKCVFKSVVIDRIKLRDQIQIMLDADIVISLPGASVMNSIYLRPLSTIIIPCRSVVGRIEYSNEIRLWLDVVPSLRIIEMCGPQVATFARDGPETTVALNISTMKSILHEAVVDWQIRHRPLEKRVYDEELEKERREKSLLGR